MWEHYVQDEPVANKPISNIRKSDIKLLYVKLLKNGLSSNTLEGINRDRRKFCVIDEPRQYENLRLSQE